MKSILELSPLARTGTVGPLTDDIVVAEPGKYYVYSSEFSDDRPLYALLDCKANKDRRLSQAAELGHEVHMHFEFDATSARVTSIKTAHVAGLLGTVAAEFDEVWIAPAAVEIEDFYTITGQRDSTKLVRICETACHEHKQSVDVTPGMIVAVMTSGRKYGLFLVKQVSPTSVSIHACHLLQA